MFDYRCSGQVSRLLQMLKDSPKSVSEIKEELNIESRRYIREHIVVPALKDGLIAMTQPDSPKSPTQKYYLTEKGKEVCC